MAHPEGLNIMVEESIQGAEVDIIAPDAFAVPQGNSLLDRAKKVVRPVMAATGLALGGLLYSGNPEEVAAREPIEEPASPAEANPDTEGYGSELYFPVLVTRQQPPAQTPIGEPTDKPIPTIRPDEPSATPTRIPSSEPSPTTAPTATATETQPPTPTSTETPETGPLRELALRTGDKFVVAVSPSKKYAMTGIIGDEASGAKALGYNFESMTEPVLDTSGKYVVGTVHRDGQPMTIRIPLEQVDPVLRDRVQQGNPEEDLRLGAEVVLWAGRGGKVKTLIVDAGGGDSLGTGLIGDLKKGAEFYFNVQVSGNVKTANIDITDYDQEADTNRILRLSYDVATRQWAIRNVVKSVSTGIYIRDTGPLHTFAKGASDLRFTFKEGVLIVPKSESQPETRVVVPDAPTNQRMAILTSKTGTRTSQASIKITEARVRFSEITDEELVESVETTLPTFAETAKKAGKRIMAETRNLTDPADSTLIQHAVALHDPLSVWYNNADEQANLLDKEKPTAIILDLGMSDTDVLQLINSNPGSIFQYGPRATLNGPIGTVINPDGTLADKQQFRKILAAIKANGSEVIINTDIPPDMKLASKTGAEQPAGLSRMMRALEEFKALGASREVTLLLAGDSEYINTTGLTDAEAIDALRYALQSVQQEAGINVGLGNIIGPGDPNIENDIGNGRSTRFYTIIGKATVGLQDITLAFNYNLTPRDWNNGSRMGLFMRGNMAQGDQSMTYSSGALSLAEIFRQEAISQ